MLKAIAGLVLIAALSLTVAAQTPTGAGTQQTAQANPNEKGCLLVRHKGTAGRRLTWFALTGVPMAPGSKFEYVEAVNYPGAKMNYKGKDLEKIQSSGVRVIVLDHKYSPADLENARKSCQ